ncbi:asparaginase domain-containing protein [Marinobacter sp. X15-166B]|uniref:asparaginase domain-containing protein n=1 Tax=Marinobacter sp. X15-166B TaxID=1897620 RepID=UPI00085CA521|nr:asparaginase domain-containing protein [Marinobacter sp. X15-166B]OEY65769.1 asparaginase [Marinobacter sp. X15-166B]
MIEIVTTGGTIDKVYFDANSEFEIGDSLVPELLAEANINDDYVITGLLRKDSLEMTDEDRERIATAVIASPHRWMLITHGTDTMVQTAQAITARMAEYKALEPTQNPDKTVVLLGSMQPARMRRSDAVFNLGFATAAVKLLPAGVYIAMNGEVFTAHSVHKNLKAQRFERL